MHTYTHTNTNNTENSFSVVSTVQQTECWSCIFRILWGKKKRTLLFEQISKESRYEPEVQVTPLSLILLTAFLKTAYPCGSD